MSLKIGVNLTRNYSINFSFPKRQKKRIKFIIIHYTGMKKESEAIKRLCNSKSKVSSHYFIKSNGEILNLVPDLYEAWHAGISNWKNFKSLNKYSLGIEIHNPGHDNGYKNFKPRQISNLEKLLRYLTKTYQIKRNFILGHSDISPNRKKDPGEKFPWNKLAKKNLCQWHNLDVKKIKKFRKQKIRSIDKKNFIKNLLKIGYFKHSDKFLIKAFQRKYRVELIDGKIDKECYLISKNLSK